MSEYTNWGNGLKSGTVNVVFPHRLHFYTIHPFCEKAQFSELDNLKDVEGKTWDICMLVF